MYTDRNKKYLAALARDDDTFGYHKWLREVREEEGQARPGAAVSNSIERTTPKPSGLVSAAEIPSPSKSSPGLRVNNGQTFHDPTWEIRLPSAKPKKKKGFGQRLLHVSHVWDDFQETRDRDAVYDYLAAVHAIVKHYWLKGRTKKLIRRAFKFAELPLDKNADPFAVIIRCTCEEKLDRKTVSKWSRALRWSARFKPKRMPLKKFMKARGGINACASLYTQCLRQSKR